MKLKKEVTNGRRKIERELGGKSPAQLVWVEKFIYGNVKKGDELVKGVEAGVLVWFSIYMMERGVRSTSWARCSCVQPLAFRLRLISWPRA